MPPSRSKSSSPRKSGSSGTGSGSSRSRGIVPPTEKPAKLTSSVHHIKKGTLPDDLEGFKSAFECHIRLLWNVITNTDIPISPSENLIEDFEKRFTSSHNVHGILHGFENNAAYRGSDAAVLQSLRELRRKCSAEGTSRTAKNISRVPENALRIIFGTVHSFGLAAWRPDIVCGSVTSIYNEAHEAIAIWTFEKAAALFAYTHFQPNLTYLQDAALMQRLYRNFVWSYIKGIVDKEAKEPGSHKRAVQENRAYKNRQELAFRRLAFLKREGFNARILSLVESPECVSDSEDNPAGGFWIMRKKARNPTITHFFRQLDQERKKVPLFRKQRQHYSEASREPHPENLESRISERIPSDCPLDWFDPNYFNSLPLQIRAQFVNSPIALPCAEDINNEELHKSVGDYRTMDYETFMQNFGNRVLEMYNVPTAEEIAAYEEAEAELNGETDL
ncbi:hypothetical protein H0H93_011515 [Arthromyces matolae]|nr:hypothetical protein H0H93_011515 [Arthromyces matolae]